MIRHIKYLLFFFIATFFSCKGERVVNKNINEEQKTVTTEVNGQDLTFSFYKSFTSCDSNVGYFSDEEAKKIYTDKIISVNSKDIVKPYFSESEFPREEDVQCIKENLNLNSVEVGFIKTNDTFPFDNLLILNKEYVIIYRDGQFFVFSRNKKSITTSQNKPKNSGKQGFDSIYNKKLVGLSVINEKEQNILKKYRIDFASSCMCNSPSLYIDKKNKEVILFNYCDNDKKFSEIENKYIFKISNIQCKDNQLVVITKDSITFTFTKTNSTELFQLSVDGKIPTDHIGNDLKAYFTPQPQKFREKDCGDFDG
ncbi:MAG: hypothetical protein ACK5MD_09850 [Flavobacteriales bacterium]